jgi:hypothetical protein
LVYRSPEITTYGFRLYSGQPRVLPSLGGISAAPWLHPVELELKELAAFASYKGKLGGGPGRNNGEAAVLAWVSINGGIAIIDEEVGRNIGMRDGSVPWLLRQRRVGVELVTSPGR